MKLISPAVQRFLSGHPYVRNALFTWKTTSLISLVAGTLLGLAIFLSPSPSPLALHAIFILTVVIFLSSILIGVRSQIERWIHAHDHSSPLDVQPGPKPVRRRTRRHAPSVRLHR